MKELPLAVGLLALVFFVGPAVSESLPLMFVAGFICLTIGSHWLLSRAAQSSVCGRGSARIEPRPLMMRSLLLGICFSSVGTVLAFVANPWLLLIAGMHGLLEKPLTLFFLCSLPVVVAFAARRLPDRAVWIVLALAPAASFAQLYIDWERAMSFLVKAAGLPASSAETNLGPPWLAGLGLGAVAAYVALLAGVVSIRLHFARQYRP